MRQCPNCFGTAEIKLCLRSLFLVVRSFTCQHEDVGKSEINIKLIFLLTSRCHVPLDKRPVPQQFIKLLISYGAQKVHYRIHNSPPLTPTPNLLTLVHALPSCLSVIHFNTTLPLMPTSFNGHFSLTSPHQNLVCVLLLICTCHIPCPSHPP